MSRNDAPLSVFIGFDPREADAFAVARASAKRHTIAPIPIRGLVLADARLQGLYSRKTERRDGRLFDVISDHPMATEFSISRFLVPKIARGWALFMDADVLVRRDLGQLFRLADPTKAVQVVKHDHQPATATKMDGQLQSAYGKKNWSSICMFNADHPANKALTVEQINTLPGRDLHQFCWLKDDEIGELPSEWNHLVGEQPARPDAAIVHFTLGVPSMAGYEHCEFADEWRDELRKWAR